MGMEQYPIILKSTGIFKMGSANYILLEYQSGYNTDHSKTEGLKAETPFKDRRQRIRKSSVYGAVKNESYVVKKYIYRNNC